MQRFSFLSFLFALTLTANLAHSAESIQLFDGESLQGWITLNGEPVKKGWTVSDGAIHLKSSEGRAGHIVTDREYGDFELTFEWKIAKGGNSGIKYRVRKFDNRVLGCEFQILDDEGHRDGNHGKKSTGSLYDLYAPSSAKRLAPEGEFNKSRIVVLGNHLEHWLNGELIISVDVTSCDWYQHKADSKFSDVIGFGEDRYGRIMLTDHGSDVWYRNLVLTPLAVEPQYNYASSRRSRADRRRVVRRFRR